MLRDERLGRTPLNQRYINFVGCLVLFKYVEGIVIGFKILDEIE